MLHETQGGVQSSNGNNHSSESIKSQEKGSNRFIIRIPRSVAASPPASIDSISSISNNSSMTTMIDMRKANADWCAKEPLPVQPLEINLTSKEQGGLMVGKLKVQNDQAEFGKNEVPLNLDTGAAPANFPEKEKLIDEFNSSIAVELSSIPNREEESNAYWVGTKKYRPLSLLFELKDIRPGALFDVRVPIEYLSAPKNVALKKRCFWGGIDGVYTDDSDAVCILLQQGYLIEPLCKIVKVTFEVLPRLATYSSIQQNGIKSRSWTCHTGLSIKFIKAVSCREPGRLKDYTNHSINSHSLCSIKFSSLSQAPLRSFQDLLLFPAKNFEKLQEFDLELEGTQTPYLLKRTKDDYFSMVKIMDGSGKVLFENLRQNDIGWSHPGISIKQTFIRVVGYRWVKRIGD